MASRRCDACGIDWPSDHSDCPKCMGETVYAANGHPVSEKEAHRLAAHAEFERWLASETDQERFDRREAYADRQARLAEQFDALASEFSQ